MMRNSTKVSTRPLPLLRIQPRKTFSPHEGLGNTILTPNLVPFFTSGEGISPQAAAES